MQQGPIPALEVRSLDKSYAIAGVDRPVIADCSFALRPGELTVVIGPSGCGKSTLVRIVAGFEAPTRGEVRSNGIPVRRPGKERLVVFQETALFPWMTTYENVAYGPRARSEWSRPIRQAADELIRRVGLTKFRASYPTQLSGGMQRRAELARAMINDPQIMILDEPFRGLDAMTKALMQEYYARLFEETKKTHLFVTTDIDEAVFLADRLLVMSNTPMQVRADIRVELPRPRRLSAVFEDDSANEVKRRALSILYEEAMRAFKGGSRAASDLVAAFDKRFTRD